ncbi:MAG: DUF721 domain-containing protein [Desulfuromonadales bacterium]|nr:DUF721 domain-containing protein [Desulfuromonadales bacterium]
MRKPRRAKMERAAHTSEVVKQLLKSLGLNEQLKQYQAIIIWEEVVGPQIAARTKPVRIRDGVMEINVDQPAWMQQLQLMKPKILTRLNDALKDGGKITDLYLKRGKVPPRQEITPEPPPAWRTVPLDNHETGQVKALLTEIEDQDLRDELEKFLLKQTRLLKAKGKD